MDISKMSLNELKVLVYDQIFLLEQINLNLKVINDEIKRKSTLGAPSPVDRNNQEKPKDNKEEKA